MPRLNPFALGRTKLTKRWDAAIDGHVVSLAWQPPPPTPPLEGGAGGGILAAASADGPITLFDTKTGQARHYLLGHGFGTACAVWSADGRHLASAGQDGKVRLWDPATGQQTCEMPGGAAWVDRVAWCPAPLPSPSGRGVGGEGCLLASAAGKKLRLWNVDGTMLCEFPDHPSTIADIQWKPNAAVLASTAYGRLFLWSPDQAEAIKEFSWQGSMLALAWSPNGDHLAAGAQDCTVHFWTLKTGKDLQMAGYPRKVRELAWDPTSRYLATGGAEVSCVWDCSGKGPAGREPIQLEAHEDYITCLAYQHQGALLASGGEDGLVALWQPGKQQGAVSLAKHAAPIAQLAWADDDRTLAVGTATGQVLLYAI